MAGAKDTAPAVPADPRAAAAAAAALHAPPNLKAPAPPPTAASSASSTSSTSSSSSAASSASASSSAPVRTLGHGRARARSVLSGCPTAAAALRSARPPRPRQVVHFFYANHAALSQQAPPAPPAQPPAAPAAPAGGSAATVPATAPSAPVGTVDEAGYDIVPLPGGNGRFKRRKVRMARCPCIALPLPRHSRPRSRDALTRPPEPEHAPDRREIMAVLLQARQGQLHVQGLRRVSDLRTQARAHHLPRVRWLGDLRPPRWVAVGR